MDAAMHYEVFADSGSIRKVPACGYAGACMMTSHPVNVTCMACRFFALADTALKNPKPTWVPNHPNPPRCEWGR